MIAEDANVVERVLDVRLASAGWRRVVGRSQELAFGHRDDRALPASRELRRLLRGADLAGARHRLFERQVLCEQFGSSFRVELNLIGTNVAGILPIPNLGVVVELAADSAVRRAYLGL